MDLSFLGTLLLRCRWTCTFFLSLCDFTYCFVSLSVSASFTFLFFHNLFKGFQKCHWRDSLEKEEMQSQMIMWFFFQEHEKRFGLIEDDLVNLQQAMHSSNSEKWMVAMQWMRSIKDYDVWDLVVFARGFRINLFHGFELKLM